MGVVHRPPGRCARSPRSRRPAQTSPGDWVTHSETVSANDDGAATRASRATTPPDECPTSTTGPHVTCTTTRTSSTSCPIVTGAPAWISSRYGRACRRNAKTPRQQGRHPPPRPPVVTARVWDQDDRTLALITSANVAAVRRTRRDHEHKSRTCRAAESHAFGALGLATAAENAR